MFFQIALGNRVQQSLLYIFKTRTCFVLNRLEGDLSLVGAHKFDFRTIMIPPNSNEQRHKDMTTEEMLCVCGEFSLHYFNVNEYLWET